MDNNPAIGPKVVQLNPQREGVLLPNKSFFNPKMFFVFGGILVLLIGLGVGTFLVTRPKSQNIGSKAFSNNQESTRAYCGKVGQTGLMITHKFTDAASCNKVYESQSKCNSYASNEERIKDPGCISYWVLYPGLVCPSNSKWGGDGRAECQTVGQCTADTYGKTPGYPNSCVMDTAVPPCSAVQYDCDDGVFQSGNQALNCSGCGGQVSATCQMVSADKDLTAIKIDDTVTFTGYGVTSAETEVVDKINFIISRDGTEVSNTEVAAARDATKDSAFSGKAWKAGQTYKVTTAGTYAVRIRAHWKDHDWKE